MGRFKRQNNKYNSNKEKFSATLYVNFEVAKISIPWVIGSSIDHSVASFTERPWWNNIRRGGYRGFTIRIILGCRGIPIHSGCSLGSVGSYYLGWWTGLSKRGCFIV